MADFEERHRNQYLHTEAGRSTNSAARAKAAGTWAGDEVSEAALRWIRQPWISERTRRQARTAIAADSG